MGEHGTTVFLSEQLSTVNGKSLNDFLDKDSIEELMNSVKASAEEIKETQKATIYGVSFCAIKIFESIINDKCFKYPVSTFIPDKMKDVLGDNSIYLSLYSKIDQEGVVPIEDYIPNEGELAHLIKSIELIKPCIPQKYL